MHALHARPVQPLHSATDDRWRRVATSVAHALLCGLPRARPSPTQAFTEEGAMGDKSPKDKKRKQTQKKAGNKAKAPAAAPVAAPAAKGAKKGK